MHWLDHKYIGLVSSRLRNFKRKSSGLYNFSCPICGDSLTRKNLARGYIYEKKGKMLFHCHNCSATMSISNFVKMIDQGLYNEMVLEKIKENKTPEQEDYEQFVEKMKKPVFMKMGPLKGLKKVSQLSPDHRVKRFVDARRIPTPYHAILFSCPNFKRYTNSLVPNKFDSDSIGNDELRLLIPFMDSNKNVHAYQGRALVIRLLSISRLFLMIQYLKFTVWIESTLTSAYTWSKVRLIPCSLAIVLLLLVVILSALLDLLEKIISLLFTTMNLVLVRPLKNLTKLSSKAIMYAYGQIISNTRILTICIWLDCRQSSSNTLLTRIPSVILPRSYN